MTARNGRRPSHDHLMAAEEALSKARDAEAQAGNKAMARFLNELVLTVFGVALRDGVDQELTTAYEAKDRLDGDGA